MFNLNQFFGEEGSKRISKWISISLMIFSLFLLVQVLVGLKGLPNVGKNPNQYPTIVVSGTGDAYAIPDIATFSFSVTESASTVKQAQDSANTKINNALAAVKAAGIDDKDIQTTGYNVYPKYQYSNAYCPQPLSTAGTVSSSIAIYCPPGKQVLTGYEVDESITVKVRDTTKVGDLVTKVGALGVSNISGVEFTVDKPEQYEAQARTIAINDAKAKAKELAKELGVSLGQIIDYNDSGVSPMYGFEAKGGTDMTSVAVPQAATLPQGQSKITANVSITYEIK